jgi:hypothetical protein
MKNPISIQSLKPVFSGLLILLTLSASMESSAKMPIYKSKIIGKTDNIEAVFSDYFELTNGVGYVAGHSDSTLYLKLEFQDFHSLMKVMQGGLNIYFDPSGKKKRNISLKLEKEPSTNRLNPFSRPGQGMQDRQLMMQNTLLSLNSTYKNATWDNYGDKFTFNKNITHKPIDAEFFINDKNNCVFNLSIPLYEIPFEKGYDILTIGIETEASSTMQGFGGQMGGGMPGGGGGRPGGGGGRSMGGGMPSERSGEGEPGQGSGSQSNSEPIRIWFQVQL